MKDDDVPLPESPGRTLGVFCGARSVRIGAGAVTGTEGEIPRTRTPRKVELAGRHTRVVGVPEGSPSGPSLGGGVGEISGRRLGRDPRRTQVWKPKRRVPVMKESFWTKMGNEH